MASAQQCSAATRREGSRACESPQTHDGGYPLLPAARQRAHARKEQCAMCETLGPTQYPQFQGKMYQVDASKQLANLVPKEGWSSQAKKDAANTIARAQEWKSNGNSVRQKQLATQAIQLDNRDFKAGKSKRRMSRTQISRRQISRRQISRSRRFVKKSHKRSRKV